MAAPTTIRRELLNARVYFIPSGESVDAVTVSASAWPDNDPTTNYTAYLLHDTETLQSERTYETATFRIPRASGGYRDDKETTLVSAMFQGVTAKTSNFLKQLEYGLASAPVAATPQSPFLRNDDFILGVALIELQNKAGTVTERIQIWAKLRLDEPGQVGPATKKLTYSIEMEDNALNTFVLVA